MKESIILLTIIGFISVSECQRYNFGPGTRCISPDGKSGICRHLRDCASQINLLKYNKTNPVVLEFLKKSICDFDGKMPIVCCTDTVTERPSNGGIATPKLKLYPRMLSPPNCGISSAVHSRIFGGGPSTLGAWPWMAALGYNARSTSKFEGYLCGGSLVSRRHVITAAHCTQQPKFDLHVVRLGDLDLNDTAIDGASPIDYLIRRVVVHPSYDDFRNLNDIAIVTLWKIVQFNHLISPICLPKGDHVRNMTFEGTTPFLIGWGAENNVVPWLGFGHLREVQVPVVSNQECDAGYKKLPPALSIEIGPTHICAGEKGGGKDACWGDSGSPLMFSSQGFYYLIGIVAAGRKCGEPGFPGVYTRTTEYLDWINKNTL